MMLAPKLQERLAYIVKWNGFSWLMVTGCLCALLQGCGVVGSAITAPPAGLHIGAPRVTGAVHGGQQPVTGATIGLYAAATTGYGATNANLLTQPVLTDANGFFTLTNLYSCSAGQQMYLTATGGDPGAGMNPQSAEMAALGDCGNLTASTFISINELTTVSAVYALAPFMSSTASVGTSATNTAGLAHAFNSAAKLVDFGSGAAPGPLLAAGASAPVAELNTLANIVASCVNSRGGAAGDMTPCGQLFTQATPAGGIAPRDTLSALLNVARNPTTNVSGLFSLTSPNAPFQPQLSAAPADWTVSINYTMGGFATPSSVAVDGGGRLWFANSGNSTVTVLDQSGTPAALLTGNGLSQPQSIAFDQGGRSWITNHVGNSVSVFNADGTPSAGSPVATASGLNAPSGLAFDALGHLWIANTGGNSLVELNADGSVAQTINSIPAPATVLINPK